MGSRFPLMTTSFPNWVHWGYHLSQEILGMQLGLFPSKLHLSYHWHQDRVTQNNARQGMPLGF